MPRKDRSPLTGETEEKAQAQREELERKCMDWRLEEKSGTIEIVHVREDGMTSNQIPRTLDSSGTELTLNLKEGDTMIQIIPHTTKKYLNPHSVDFYPLFKSYNFRVEIIDDKTVSAIGYNSFLLLGGEPSLTKRTEFVEDKIVGTKTTSFDGKEEPSNIHVAITPEIKPFFREFGKQLPLEASVSLWNCLKALSA